MTSGGHQSGIQQHEYSRSEFCQNYTDANGVTVSKTCSHIKHYQEPHCSWCNKEKSNIVHKEH